MNKRDSAKQLAFLRVKEVFLKFPEQVAGNPFLASEVPVFLGIISSIDATAQKTAAYNPLPASNKKEARDSVENMSLSVGRLVWIFASKEGNLDLMNTIQRVRSGLQKMRDMNLMLYCQNLNEVVTTNLVALAAVGITEEMANRLDQAVQVYSNIITEPKDRINKEKQLNIEIHQQVNDAYGMLKNTFDLLMAAFPQNSDFVIAYNAARVVVKPATQHHKEETSPQKDK